MKYAEINNREIVMIVEKAQRSDRIVVWGSFRKGKEFKRYFDSIQKAMEYYNKKANIAINIYLEKTAEILKKY